MKKPPPLTFVSLFSGIGGFDLGFERAGMRGTVQVEIDRQCRALLGKKFSALQLADVRAIAAVHRRLRRGRPILHYEKWQKLFELLRDAAVWCGGFPCQDLSLAGARRGLAGERSGLWFVFRRLVALFRPPWVVIENVPGLLSSQGGRDLALVLHGLEERGYWWAYRVFDAQYFGLAQRRERVFVVASLGNFGCAEVLFEPESVPRDHPPRRQSREGPTGTLTRRALDGSGPCGGDGREKFLVAHTLRAEGFDASEDGTGRGVPLVTATLDRKTCAAQRGCQTNETDFLVTGTLNPGKHPGSYNGQDAAAGNLVVAGAHGDGTRVAGSVSVKWTKGTGGPSGDECQNLVADPITVPEGRTASHGGNNPRPRNCVAFTSKDFGGDSTDELSPTLRAMPHRASHANGGGQVAVAFDAVQITSKTNRSQPKPGDPCHTLTKNSRSHAAERRGVRRLTPLECERLQGFPDNWTAGYSDSVRYRMLGNAVAVPCAEWLGHRIVRHPRDKPRA